MGGIWVFLGKDYCWLWKTREEGGYDVLWNGLPARELAEPPRPFETKGSGLQLLTTLFGLEKVEYSLLFIIIYIN